MPAARVVKPFGQGGAAQLRPGEAHHPVAGYGVRGEPSERSQDGSQIAPQAGTVELPGGEQRDIPEGPPDEPAPVPEGVDRLAGPELEATADIIRREGPGTELVVGGGEPGVVHPGGDGAQPPPAEFRFVPDENLEDGTDPVGVSPRLRGHPGQQVLHHRRHIPEGSRQQCKRQQCQQGTSPNQKMRLGVHVRQSNC